MGCRPGSREEGSVDRRQFVRGVVLGGVSVAAPMVMQANGCEDTGAGQAQQNPIQKAADDTRNYHVYLEVECDPSNHPWTLSYRCGSEDVTSRPMTGTFTREIIQTGTAEISIRAKQKEQGTLRAS